MSVRLYFGNLPRDLEREAFEALLQEDSENLVSVKLISDSKTGKCRGFGFVTVKDDSIADALVEKYNGSSFQEATLRVEKAREKESSTESRENSSSSRRSKKGGSRRGGNTVVVSETESAAAEPDPRWAQDLAKLKEMLAAQATPS